MAGLNRVQLIGRLGAEPETRTITAGWQVCNFRLAVDRRYRDSNGQTVKKTDWFNVEAWRRLGEICQEYLHKGRLVFPEGRLQTDRYEKDEKTQYYTKVVLEQMQMLDRRPGEGEAEESEAVAAEG